MNSIRGKEMMTYLPKYYETSRVMTEGVIEPQGIEFDAVMSAILSVADQFFARTATWSLPQWETELGLPPALPGATDAERQDRIVSKLRGQGTATIRIVKESASAYENGSVDAIQDHTLSTVIIRFVDSHGLPSNLSDFQTQIREIIPAHLGIVYEYNYTVWDDIDSLGITWDDLEAMNMTWDELEVAF